ncbi:DNA cytosine methyltransferase [Natrinema sp. LN54]|uniref:DNA cytosine methyltransferase n=1 Tax=Natrinema sp. LN54 TaxID=3458705 RepID=UPI004035D1FB
MENLKVIDLFCGAGGASTGLIRAGYDVVGAVDAYQEALDTYRKNLCEGDLTNEFPGSVTFDKPLRADLSQGYDDSGKGENLPEITFEDIRENFELEEGEVDVICGCPPCQNFSSLRDTEPWPDGKPKDGLLRAFVDFIREEVPDVVLFENVSNILNAGEEVPSTYVDWFIRQMKNITRPSDSPQEGGYGYTFKVVNAADYGVPQRRRRTIGIFIYGAEDEEVTIPAPTHARDPEEDSDREPWVEVQDRIFREDLKTDLDLGQKQTGIDGYPDDPAHRSRRHHDSTIEMIEAIREHGGSWKDLRGTNDKDLIKECHQDLSSGARSAYGIMAKDEPAPTLTTRCANVSSGRFTHPTENRAITFREAALLMGFPRDYKLPSVNEHAERVVGNAVPPLLIKKAAEHARSDLQQVKKKEITEAA